MNYMYVLFSMHPYILEVLRTYCMYWHWERR